LAVIIHPFFACPRLQPGVAQLVALVVVALAGCSRAPEPPSPWVQPPEQSWGDLPKTDEDARALVTKEALPTRGSHFDMASLAMLRADASKAIAGEDAIAAAYDTWISADSKKPSYLLFGTLHDSRTQIETVLAIASRMRRLWGFALEQFRVRGHWQKAPETPSDDEGDLATLTQRSLEHLDDTALYRIRERQLRFGHAAWKFGYLPALTNLLYAARGAGMPIFGCDMPPELRASLSPLTERGMRELHCARALRGAARSLVTLHAPDGGLVEDDEAPPERFAVLLGADHAEPDGLPRFLAKNARWLGVRVLGGRPHDAGGEESALAAHLAVLDPVLLRNGALDLLLLPDDTWGGNVDRTKDHGDAPVAVPGLPRSNVTAASDEAARFAIGESSMVVGSKPEWLQTRAGHQAYVLVSPTCSFVGAVDVPDAGYAELHFTPKERAVRIVIHTP